ncbi:PEGA domain-containing protein [Myxococcaceae bacterium GXIMD 01537]
MKALALAALLPALALAAPPQKISHRASALLIPMDPGAEASTLKLETYINEALSQFGGYTVRKPEELFGLPANTEAEASMERGKKGFEESLAAYEQKDYEDAERKVRATLKELQTAGAAMRGCSPLCDATALYAAILHQRGDVEEAKLILIDLIALNPTFELNPKRYTREFILLRAQVATGRNAQLRGNAQVKSRPAGARVYVNGEFQGYTPITLQTLPIGKHLMRLERPGFQVYGQLLEISPDDSEVSAELVPTSAYKAYDAQLDRVASEVVRNAPAPSVTALGKQLKLDRALVGTLRELPENNGLELMLGLFETPGGKRLGSRRLVLQGDEFGQLKAEVSRAVNHMVNNVEGGGEKVVKSSDPLDNRYGTEEWGAEDKGGKTRTKEQKRKKPSDPLEGVSGTEDW